MFIKASTSPSGLKNQPIPANAQASNESDVFCSIATNTPDVVVADEELRVISLEQLGCTFDYILQRKLSVLKL